MTMFNTAKRTRILDLLLDDDNMTLGVYDTADVRRYWMKLPETRVADGKLIIGNIPPLPVDETFTVGYLRIDNVRGKEVVRIALRPPNRLVVAGESLHLGDVTLSID